MSRSALPVGSRLGEMEILRVLAHGGFGIVYLARDHSLDRDVAVKEYMPSHLADRSQGEHVVVRSPADAETYALGLRAFVNEAKLLAQFSHSAMVKVFRIWEANGTAYMAMPYLRGPTLIEVRNSMSAPPTEAWLRSVIDPLLDALEMLHAQGFYHRDIAPDNVLVSGPGLPVLLDFGAARRVIGDRTQSFTAVLKPRYAPIEQYAETTKLRQGPWTDLYALAAMVTYLLDGLAPPPATARSIHDEMHVLADRDIPGVSRAFLSAMDWALAVRPQDRPQSVAALRDALNGRLTPPLPDRERRPPPLPQARTAPVPVSAPPFPTTVRLHGGKPARAGFFAASRPWLVVPTSLLVAVTVAWSLIPNTSTDQPPARAEPAAKPTTSRPLDAPLAAAPAAATAELLPPATLQVTAASTALPAVESAAAPRVSALTVQRSEHDIAAERARHAKVKKSTSRKIAQDRNVAAGPAAPSVGPAELCASRNFFFRPYCIQRRCEEPRFKAVAQCVQLRQMARRHDD